ncbi:tRNA(Ile)-lysidine synthase domain protein, partial [Serratia plymuthica A30]
MNDKPMNTDQLSVQVSRQLGTKRHLLVAFSGGLDS